MPLHVFFSCVVQSAIVTIAGSALPPGFYVLDPAKYESSLREDFEWAKANTPFIDMPGLPDIQTAFYYRWRSYKKHITATPEGFVVTEFLPKVAWAGKYNTIPAAAGHHIVEGRWIHNKSYLDDYITFWFRRGGNPRKYTSWFAWAAWQRHLVQGDDNFIIDIFPDLLTNIRQWTLQHRGDYGGRLCYYQTDGSDAMEVSISGSGCRPTIESAMFGESVALLEIAKLAGNASAIDELTKLREETRQVVLGQMWNPHIQSFAVIPLPAPPTPPTPAHQSPQLPIGFKLFNQGQFCCDQKACSGGNSSFLYAGVLGVGPCIAKCAEIGHRCHYITVSTAGSGYCMVVEHCNSTAPFANHPEAVWTYSKDSKEVGLRNLGGPSCPGDGHTSWAHNETVSVRELLAFMPWYFSLSAAIDGQLIPSASVSTYEPMWRQLFDEEGFAAPWGLRSAELRSPCYNYSWAHHDCWNGPSWPYETARVLTSAANFLNDYPKQKSLNASEYIFLLDQYAKQHTQTFADRDTAHPLGSGHIFEVLHPDLGYWIDRDDGHTDMGDEYNHSTFIDLVLSGLLGLRPRADSTIVLNPLVPLGLLSHFAVDHVKYHGYYLSVVWDADGSHYGMGKGLKILVDGQVIASSNVIERLSADLSTIIFV